MTELFSRADGWFISLVAAAGSLYFLWSAKNILSDLKEEIAELKTTIREIFEFRTDHERRISRIEGICKGRRDADGAAKCGE